MVRYKPFFERTPDTQYCDLLTRIRYYGVRVETQQEHPAVMVFGHQMRFDLTNGFPIITERDLTTARPGYASQFVLGIAELFAFLNGARTLKEMRDFGCGWWQEWVTEEKCAKRGLEPGDLGPGSYGAAFRSFPTAEGRPFDQITHVIEQIRELPHLRTHLVTPFIPQYLGRGAGKQQKVVVVPCHGLFHVFVNTATGELSLHHFQRSADAPVGLVFNLTQYALLTLMLAQVTGYTARELVFTISDAHIYVGGPKDQMPDVLEMLATQTERLPTVELDSTVQDIFAFRPEHVSVRDYYPKLPPRRIPTPV